MSGSAGRGGHAVYSFSLCHPLIFFHPFLRSLPAPARRSGSFWLDLPPLLSDNDTRFTGYQTTAPPIFLPSPFLTLSFQPANHALAAFKWQ